MNTVGEQHREKEIRYKDPDKVLELFEHLYCTSCRGTKQVFNEFHCSGGHLECMEKLDTRDPTWYKKSTEDIPSSEIVPLTSIKKENIMNNNTHNEKQA